MPLARLTKTGGPSERALRRWLASWRTGGFLPNMRDSLEALDVTGAEKVGHWGAARSSQRAASDEAPACRGLIAFDLFGGSVWAFAQPALGETVGWTVHLQDVEVVGQAVEQCASEAFVAEG